jgi:hypothetical protein
VAFFDAAENKRQPAVSGLEGRTALALALRVQQQIIEHASRAQVEAVRAQVLQKG